MSTEGSQLDSDLDTVLLGGREPVTILLVDYDPAWPERFAAERARIVAALGSAARRVEHIGSTAVPGLAAKPIVDILVEVADPEDENSFRAALEHAGYELRVREAGHRMFRTPARDVHVHLWRAGRADVADYLLLRDWLRVHADDRLRYERAKRDLAGRSWRDMNYYAEAKGPVIAQIMGRARAGAGGDPYYRPDLALVHHRGFAAHAAACAPGILALLAPILARDGVVLELGCGTGLLTEKLIAAGHRVIATDASPAMLDVARTHLGPRAQEVRRLTLPDDPLPQADAIVAIGHPISYLPDAAAVGRALIAIAGALRPGGLLALDICDTEWGTARRNAPDLGRTGPDWAIITEYSMPSPDRFVRDITTFLPNADGSWRRDTEHHENVLMDTAGLPALLAEHGVEARVGARFGTETLPDGLRVVIGHRRR